MAWRHLTGRFVAADLVKVPDPARPVVLKSGGPIMSILTVEGDRALCEWAGDGETQRGLFPLACLYEVRPLRE